MNLYMHRAMRKPTVCICENKGADQLRNYCEADQRLCYSYTNSTIPLLVQPLAIFCNCTAWFVLDLFENHIVVFFHEATHDYVMHFNNANVPTVWFSLSYFLM